MRHRRKISWCGPPSLAPTCSCGERLFMGTSAVDIFKLCVVAEWRCVHDALLSPAPCPQFTLPCSVKWDAMDNQVGRWLPGQATGQAKARRKSTCCCCPLRCPCSSLTTSQHPLVFCCFFPDQPFLFLAADAAAILGRVPRRAAPRARANS